MNRSDRPEPAAATSAPRIGRSALFAILPVALLAIQGWDRRWLSDDGLIGVRVADQLLHGHGLVFNAGERVETSTTPLWIMLTATIRFLRLAEFETAMVALGLISTTAGLALACWGATLLWRREGPRPAFVLPVGALVVAVLPPMWEYTTSGLETSLSFLWLGGSFRLLAGMADSHSPSLRQARAAAIAVGLGPLVRPDFAIFTVLFLIAILVMAGKATTAGATRRRVVGLLATALAVPMAYQLFRMGFYASLVPNTAFAKEASEAWWSQGLHYLRDFLRPYWLLVPLTAAVLFLAAGAHEWRRHEARARARLLVAAAPVAGGLLHGLYVVRTGGDFMHARFLLPSLVAVLLPVAVVEVRGFVRWVAVAVAVPWAVVCATQLRLDYSRHHGLSDGHGIADERRFYAVSARRFNPVDVDHWSSFQLYKDGEEAERLIRTGTRLLAWRSSAGEPGVYAGVPLRPDLPFKAAYITGNLGITGVRAGRDVHIIDPSGLSDPFAGRVRLTARGRPGHEKRLDFVWIQARFADPEVVPDDAAHQVYGGRVQPAPGAVAAARRALRCGALRDLERAVTEPLTPGRFLRNIHVAIRLHSFRLDADPVSVEARVCRG